LDGVTNAFVLQIAGGGDLDEPGLHRDLLRLVVEVEATR